LSIRACTACSTVCAAFQRAPRHENFLASGSELIKTVRYLKTIFLMRRVNPTFAIISCSLADARLPRFVRREIEQQPISRLTLRGVNLSLC